MIPDKLLINLKIISKIQKNGRIARSYDGIISLENDVFYQSVKRFVSNDSRRQAIFEINSVITECVEILYHILNSKHMNKNFCQSDEYIKACENINLIIHEMELARCGVENLKFTYQNDPNIVSQIDIVILKINTTVKDISQKLIYFESFLQNNHYETLSYYNNVIHQGQGNLNAEYVSGQGNLNAEYVSGQGNINAEYVSGQGNLNAEYVSGQGTPSISNIIIPINNVDVSSNGVNSTSYQNSVQNSLPELTSIKIEGNEIYDDDDDN